MKINCWLLSLCLLTVAARGEETLPEPEPVPSKLAEPLKKNLTSQYNQLATGLRVFKADAQAFNLKPAKSQTDGEFNSLKSRRANYLAAATAFNREILLWRKLNAEPDDLAIPDPPLTSDRDHRSPDQYLKIIGQYDVEHSARYKANAGKTYCNVFARDVVHAMGAELPAAKTANNFQDWLNGDGKKEGWHRVDVRMAGEVANQGRPTIVIWKNTMGSHGHVAVVRPDPKYDTRSTSHPHGGLEVAQAGSHNWVMVPEDRGFNNPDLIKETQYWYHE